MSDERLVENFRRAESIIRTGPTHKRFSAALVDAVAAVNQATADYVFEREKVLGLLREDGVSDFAIWQASAFPCNVRVSDQAYRGSVTRSFLSTDKEVRRLQLTEHRVTEGLHRIVDLLAPTQPYGWMGTYDEDVVTLDDLRSYLELRSHSLLFSVPGDRAVGSTSEAVLNADLALSEWGHVDRPRVPDAPLTNIEAKRQFRQYIHWIDGKRASGLMPPAGRSANEVPPIPELNERKHGQEDGAHSSPYFWVKGIRYEVKVRGESISWKLVRFFWDRNEATYDELADDHDPQSVWRTEIDSGQVATALTRFRSEVPTKPLGWTLRGGAYKVTKKFHEISPT